MTFSLHDFLMAGFRDAVGKMADYQIILNAAGWQTKGVLEDKDLAELQELINQKNAPEPEMSMMEANGVPLDANGMPMSK